MIPEPTHAEHLHAMADRPDSLGYCYNLYTLKCNTRLQKPQFFTVFSIWLRKTKNVELIAGCETIKNYFSKKFA